MFMTVALNDEGTSKIKIFGTVYGGEDTGSGYGTAGLWKVSFEYAANVFVEGDGTITVAPEDNANNRGWITPLFTGGGFTAGESIGLWITSRSRMHRCSTWA
jgi:hypothetical protein